MAKLRDKVRGDVADETLQAMCLGLTRETGLKIEFGLASERLGRGEQLELHRLYRKLTEKFEGISYGTRGTVPSPFPEAQAAEEFASALEKLDAGGYRDIEHGNTILVERTRATQRVPTKSEINVRPPLGSTLEDMTPEYDRAREADRPRGIVAADPSWSRSWNPAALSAEETARLEELIELAIDRPGFFAKRRETEAMGRRVRELAAMARPKPAAKPKYDPVGSVVLLAGILDDLERNVIWQTDVGTLATLLLCFENGRVWSGARIEGDQIIVRRQGTFLPPGSCPPGNMMGLRVGSGSLGNLAHARWVDVWEESGETHIRKGKRMLALDEARKVAA